MCKKRPMSNPSMLDQDRPADPKSSTTNEPNESFGDILSQYEQSHDHRIREEGKRGLEGTVVAITGENVFLDIGFKTEGILPVAGFQATGDTPKVGDKLPVTIKGRDPEGYYELSRFRERRPTDWSGFCCVRPRRRPVAEPSAPGARTSSCRTLSSSTQRVAPAPTVARATRSGR